MNEKIISAQYLLESLFFVYNYKHVVYSRYKNK